MSISPCRACGAADPGRICAACGTPNRPVSNTGDEPSTVPETPHLIDVEPQPQGPTPEAAQRWERATAGSANSGADRRLLVIVGALVVGLLLGGLWWREQGTHSPAGGPTVITSVNSPGRSGSASSGVSVIAPQTQPTTGAGTASGSPAGSPAAVPTSSSSGAAAAQ